MKKTLCLLMGLLLLLLCPLAQGQEAEKPTGIVGKVTTPKGALKLRAKKAPNGRMLAEIPNGTCLLVLEEDEAWCRVVWEEKEGYCSTEFLTMLRDANLELLDYRVLRLGDQGEDVTAMKRRLQELGYIRAGSKLTSLYNDIAAERVRLFQRQTGMTEDGIASQELQAYLFSEKAPACTQTLPRVRARVVKGEEKNRVICGCCFGEGCECCGFKGWIQY